MSFSITDLKIIEANKVLSSFENESQLILTDDFVIWTMLSLKTVLEYLESEGKIKYKLNDDGSYTVSKL